MTDAYRTPYFFDSGLRFACTRCGRCCTGEPGIIYVGTAEADPIARFLNISTPQFIQNHTRPYRDGYSIREHDDGCCVFYQAGCRIYPVRPVQCRTYPFWFRYLRSEKHWQSVAAECPGVGQGPVVDRERILALVRMTMPRPSGKTGFP